jgi:hypothetical protein
MAGRVRASEVHMFVVVLMAPVLPALRRKADFQRQ